MRHQWLDDDDDEPQEDDRRHKEEGGLGLPEGDKIGKLYFKSRTVIVAGTINDKLAQRTVAHLLALAEDSDKPINMLISSPGGHVESGDMIHDVIKFIRPNVRTIGSGWVASAAPVRAGLTAPTRRRNRRYTRSRPADTRAPHHPRPTRRPRPRARHGPRSAAHHLIRSRTSPIRRRASGRRRPSRW